jgi:hypothetical protein
LERLPESIAAIIGAFSGAALTQINETGDARLSDCHRVGPRWPGTASITETRRIMRS